MYLMAFVPPMTDTLWRMMPALEKSSSCQSVSYCGVTGVRVVKS